MVLKKITRFALNFINFKWILSLHRTRSFACKYAKEEKTKIKKKKKHKEVCETGEEERKGEKIESHVFRIKSVYYSIYLREALSHYQLSVTSVTHQKKNSSFVSFRVIVCSP